MLDEQDLHAIGQMMDAKLTAQKREVMNEVKVLLDTEVQTKFNLLAERQQDILERLVSHSCVDELEDEVEFLKVLFRQMNEELQLLKKDQ